MPCSDGGPPSQKEYATAEVAQHLMYLYDLGRITKPSDRVREAARYTSSHLTQYLDEWTAFLCDYLSKCTQYNLDAIVYNARDKRSRALADWWERHQEEDRIREAEEKAERERKSARQSAIAKLTPAERKALGL